jgi:hypothetical protein
MATIRVGFGSDFKVSDSKIGIGTANPTALLEVSETAKADFNITGVTTLTSYGGFIAQNQHVNKPSAIGFATTNSVGTLTQYYETETGFTDLGGVHHGDDQRFNTLSEDLVIDEGQILNITNTEMVGRTTIGEYDPHSHSSYVCAGSLEQVSVTGHFSVPNGGSNDRKDNPIEGTVRFNTDLNTLEFFNGNEWKQFTYSQQSGRAVFGGGVTPAIVNTIEYVQISTFGNALDFGDLVGITESPGSCSSSTRGLFSGGRNPGQLDRMDYITIASTGNAIDFGNLTDSGRIVYNAVSSSTRGVNLGGYKTSTSANINTIDYVELPTLGNALDFGDVTTTRRSGGDCSSPTRGIYAGGFGSVAQSVIESLTIASKGNTVRFGELSFRGYGQAGCSNPIMGIFAGGNQDGSASGERAEISYINIASEGNATYFGDLAVARMSAAAASNSIRGVFAGGYTPTILSSIETILISEGGNALDFGDLSNIRKGFAGTSDSHGGLGGF